MIFDHFLTLGFVEDINVFVKPSNTVPYCTAIAPAPEVQLTLILFLGQVHTKHLVLGF